MTAGGAKFASEFPGVGESHPAGACMPASGFLVGSVGELASPAAREQRAAQLAAKPQWHAARRELFFGEILVKRFRVPARNQEWILEVFEEDAWPESIDDPLPPTPDICPKARLHDAINRLNHKQINPLIRFHGTGNGQAIYWQAVGRSPQDRVNFGAEARLESV